MSVDMVITGATVIDAHQFDVTDVAVADGRICAIGDGLAQTHGVGAHIVDGTDRYLMPGFIDMHAHSAIRLFSEPELAAKISSGFTTELICPDGLGPAPVRAEARDGRRRYLAGLEPGTAPWDWESFADYLGAVDAARPATSIVSCVPHSAVREVVMGNVAREATLDELHRMRDLVGECLAAGGAAVSFGLIYAPGLYANTEELTVVADAAAEYRVPLMPHVRNEADQVVQSVREFVDVCERTGAPLHLSHLKIIGNAHLLDDLMNLIDEASNRIDITFDQYPYGAGSTLLSALLPPYAFEGGADPLLCRLSDPSERRRMARDMRTGLSGWENIFGSVGPGRVDITQATGHRSTDVGRTIEEIADERKTSPEEAVFDLLVDTELDAAMIDHYAAEETVRSIFGHRLAMVGSDGVFNQSPHPRLYGTTGRVLGRYVFRDNLVPVQEAVARLTSRPAERLGLHDRGLVAEGLRADLVLLDPAAFVDRATFAAPTASPDGIDLVVVGGETAWENGTHTGARNGTVRASPA